MKLLRFTRLAGMLVAVACGDGPVAPSASGVVDLSREWYVAPPISVGADTAQLRIALAGARTDRYLLSVLVVKDGSLVVEEYLNGNDRDQVNDVRSVTKSIVSTLTGLALERGDIESLDQSIADFLDPDVAVLTPAERAITIRHLLTMSSGFGWQDATDYNAWLRSGGQIADLLDVPLVTTPGTAFQYNTAAVHMLGVVVARATGMPLEDFAQRTLFSRIGVRDVEWEPMPSGYVNGGAGIDLRPRDLARFGQLFLQDGRSGSDRVLPAGWVNTATQPRYGWAGIAAGAAAGVTYGFLWWIVTGEPEPAYFAWGFGGQFIYVVPSIRLVAVVTTRWQNVTGFSPETSEHVGLDLIVHGLVPAFR